MTFRGALPLLGISGSLKNLSIMTGCSQERSFTQTRPHMERRNSAFKFFVWSGQAQVGSGLVVCRQIQLHAGRQRFATAHLCREG